jgi:branched-chain amino acid transport system permease protein
MSWQHTATHALKRAGIARVAGFIAAAVVTVVLVLLPLSATPFTNLQISLIAAYAVAIRGLGVLTGHAGQVSLAQSAFFGVGAYGAAYAADHGWPAAVGLLLAVAVAALAGVLIAIPAVRLRGFAFGILTLAVPVVAVPLANRLSGLTGGSQGKTAVLLPAPEWSGLADDQWHYYVVLVIAALIFLLVHNLLTGRFSRALDLLRANETVAAAMGVPVQRYKVIAFTISAACGGAAGWLYLVPVRFISPDSLQLTLSISLLVALVVGGVRSPIGAVVGATFYVLLPNFTDKVTPGRSYLFFGIALLIVLLFFPSGVTGGLRSLADRLFRKESSSPSAAAMSGSGEPFAE